MKKISIVIPTFNRGDVIATTLSLFYDQVVRNCDDVELIVCNNASTDNTKDVLTSILGVERWFTYIEYDTHVNIDESIYRSIGHVTSDFFLLFGDDDIPAPMMVDVLLSTLRKHPKIGLLTFNRLIGFSNDSLCLKDITVCNSNFQEFEILYTDSKVFTEKFYEHMGFISVDVVNTEVWIKGSVNFDVKHAGYSFLTVMHSGANGYDCLYLEYPLCMQRIVLTGGNEHAFSSAELGIYQFVSIPRILRKLEELNIINNWSRCFAEYSPNKSDRWYYTVVSFIAKDPKKFSKYYDEIIEYQIDKKRKLKARKLFTSIGRKTFLVYYLILKLRSKGGLQYIRRKWGELIK